MTMDNIIAKGIEYEIKKAADVEINKAIDNLRKRIDEIVASTAVTILRQVSFERIGGELVIRVQMKDVK